MFKRFILLFLLAVSLKSQDSSSFFTKEEWREVKFSTVRAIVYGGATFVSQTLHNMGTPDSLDTPYVTVPCFLGTRSAMGYSIVQTYNSCLNVGGICVDALWRHYTKEEKDTRPAKRRKRRSKKSKRKAKKTFCPSKFPYESVNYGTTLMWNVMNAGILGYAGRLAFNRFLQSDDLVDPIFGLFLLTCSVDSLRNLFQQLKTGEPQQDRRIFGMMSTLTLAAVLPSEGGSINYCFGYLSRAWHDKDLGGLCVALYEKGKDSWDHYHFRKHSLDILQHPETLEIEEVFEAREEKRIPPPTKSRKHEVRPQTKHKRAPITPVRTTPRNKIKREAPPPSFKRVGPKKKTKGIADESLMSDYKRRRYTQTALIKTEEELCFSEDENNFRWEKIEEVEDIRNNNSATKEEINTLLNKAMGFIGASLENAPKNKKKIVLDNGRTLAKYESNHRQKREKSSVWKGHKLGRVLDACVQCYLWNWSEDAVLEYFDTYNRRSLYLLPWRLIHTLWERPEPD